MTSPLPRLDAVAEIVGMGCANPPFELSQGDGLAFALHRVPMREATRRLYARVLSADGISTRQFGVERLDDVLEPDPDRVLDRYRRWAVTLSARALEAALGVAGLASSDVDYLAVTTCTGYLCPGLTSYVSECCGLRADVRRVDVVGMGCGAALPAIEQATLFLSAHPEATAAVISTEICSAAIFFDDAPDLVVSNAIFGDGSAATVLRAPAARTSDAPPRAASAPARTRLVGFRSLLVPEWREGLRFRTDGGRLRNVLSREVPPRAGEACQRLATQLLADHGLDRDAIAHWIIHAGGKAVVDAVQAALSLDDLHVASAREVLRVHGNMSSPTVLFVLDEERRARPPRPGALGVMLAFGAGFSAHAALVAF